MARRIDKDLNRKMRNAEARRFTAFGPKLRSAYGSITPEQEQRNRDYMHRPAYADYYPMKKK